MEATISFELWILVIGGLLAAMGLAQPLVRRLPITPAIVYLLIGAALGPWGFDAIRLDPFEHTAWLHHASEIAVVVSLFTVGLKLRAPIDDPALRPALCLASLSMVITIALVAILGHWLLGLSLGAAVLLGAILAPTDPVLASDVQVRHPLDRDRLRLTLTAEGGLNDGTAFPFVMLGLGLLGLHGLGPSGSRWIIIDLIWAVAGGLLIGTAIGYGAGQILLRMRDKRQKALAGGEYLVLGLIGISYSLAIQAKAYGFLAVFAAGLALRAVERRASGKDPAADEAISAIAEGRPPRLAPSDERAAPAYAAGALLATNEQLERILEVALVLMVGAMAVHGGWSVGVALFAAVIFIVIRPLAALPLLALGKRNLRELGLVAWFGIRGIGSIYYLMYAIDHGLEEGLARELVGIAIPVIAFSLLVHGISVTPLLARREAKAGKPSARHRQAGRRA